MSVARSSQSKPGSFSLMQRKCEIAARRRDIARPEAHRCFAAPRSRRSQRSSRCAKASSALNPSPISRRNTAILASSDNHLYALSENVGLRYRRIMAIFSMARKLIASFSNRAPIRRHFFSQARRKWLSYEFDEVDQAACRPGARRTSSPRSWRVVRPRYNPRGPYPHTCGGLTEKSYAYRSV
jgi:hypothetical protein